MSFVKKLKTLVISVGFFILLSIPVSAGSYTVQKNDTVYYLGKTFNVSTSTLMSLNSLKSSYIYPGQVLNVPFKTTYSVRSGDVLYKIAQNFSVTTFSLKKANNEWDAIIYPGQRLNIPYASATSGQSAGISYTASDLDLLARLIRAEAESESYTAKVGVGAVIVNRVKSKDWPNTIRSVIYQVSGGYYQFTPVENGYINRAADQTSKDAAYSALHGNDPTKGAIFYFDDSTTNKWIWSRPIALRVGHMVYAY